MARRRYKTIRVQKNTRAKRPSGSFDEWSQVKRPSGRGRAKTYSVDPGPSPVLAELLAIGGSLEDADRRARRALKFGEETDYQEALANAVGDIAAGDPLASKAEFEGQYGGTHRSGWQSIPKRKLNIKVQRLDTVQSDRAVRRYKRKAKAKKRDYSNRKAQPRKGDSWSIA